MQYWILVANPKNYRIEDAINNLPIDTWTTRGRRISKGDRVAIWKALGKSDKRGIVCLGEVISNVTTDGDKTNQYWLNPDMANENASRVFIRYVHAPGLPLWLGGSEDKLLESLSVFKSRGTVFKVTPAQWDSILDAVGGRLKIKKNIHTGGLTINKRLNQSLQVVSYGLQRIIKMAPLIKVMIT
jgi:hypothetical protein